MWTMQYMCQLVLHTHATRMCRICASRSTHAQRHCSQAPPQPPSTGAAPKHDELASASSAQISCFNRASVKPCDYNDCVFAEFSCPLTICKRRACLIIFITRAKTETLVLYMALQICMQLIHCGPDLHTWSALLIAPVKCTVLQQSNDLQKAKIQCIRHWIFCHHFVTGLLLPAVYGGHPERLLTMVVLPA